MKWYLVKEGCWDVVEKESKPDSVTAAKWAAEDSKAMANIVLSVSDGQVAHIRNAKSAKEAWELLKEYHLKGSMSSQVYLLKKLYKAELEKNGDMKKHLEHMFSWFDELSEIGHKEEEYKQVLILLASLNDEYRTIVTALEARDVKTLKLSEVRIKLIEEFERKSGLGTSSDGEAAMKFRDVGRGRRKVICFFCGGEGHMKRDCDKLKEVECYRCGKKGHYQSACPEKASMARMAREAEEETWALQVRAKTSEIQRDEWIVDSGSSVHVCNDKNAFMELDESVKKELVVANGKIVATAGIGKIKLKVSNGSGMQNITVEEVLYVPGMAGSLLSVKKLTEKGCSVEFSSTGCKVTKDNRIIIVAGQSEGVYKLNRDQGGQRSSIVHRASSVKPTFSQM